MRQIKPPQRGLLQRMVGWSLRTEYFLVSSTSPEAGCAVSLLITEASWCGTEPSVLTWFRDGGMDTAALGKTHQTGFFIYPKVPTFSSEKKKSQKRSNSYPFPENCHIPDLHPQTLPENNSPGISSHFSLTRHHSSWCLSSFFPITSGSCPKIWTPQFYR